MDANRAMILGQYSSRDWSQQENLSVPVKSFRSRQEPSWAGMIFSGDVLPRKLGKTTFTLENQHTGPRGLLART